MSEPARSLSEVWLSDRPVDKERVMSAVDAVLGNDRAARERERRVRIGMLLALTFLLPTLLWFAAHGVTPLVRGAYALMAAGAAVIVYAEWTYLEWSQQAFPGPADARSHLQKTAFMVARQVLLMKMAPIWWSPVFIGAALIGAWLYRERTHAEAFLVWVLTGAGWLVTWLGAIPAVAKLDERKRQIERLLSELQ